MATKSGKYWVSWANVNAKNSNSINDLHSEFQENVRSFIDALKNAGASVSISTTTRSKNRAYLFHWSWKISQGKCKPSDAKKLAGVDIEWDHGNIEKSKAGALEMVKGFGLAVPPRSIFPPSLSSNHIEGKAIDMTVSWTGNLKVKKKDGTVVTVAYMKNVNGNNLLHTVGESYGVKKLKSDAPHWSYNGR